MKKGIAIVAVIVVVLIGVTVFKFMSSLDAIVQRAIEKYGSEATGTQVTVASVDIQLRKGRAELGGIVVANPGAYEGDAFRLGAIVVDIDPGTVREDPLVIDEIHIDAPEVWLVVRADGSTNVDEIRRNLDAASARGGGTSKGSGDGKERHLLVRRFVFAEGVIHADATAAGAERPVEVELPSLELTDVGGASGAPPEEVSRIITKAFTRRITEVAAKKGLEAAVKKGLGDKAEDEAKGLLDRLTD